LRVVEFRRLRVRGQAQSGTTPGTQPPGTIAIDVAEVRGHRILPEKAIHADLTFQELFSEGTVTLSVVVNPYGKVESAHAVRGIGRFYPDAESIEMERTFKLFLKAGVPVRAFIEDYVSLCPPEKRPLHHVLFPAVQDPINSENDAGPHALGPAVACRQI
jgi:hypothetical protein